MVGSLAKVMEIVRVEPGTESISIFKLLATMYQSVTALIYIMAREV